MTAEPEGDKGAEHDAGKFEDTEGATRSRLRRGTRRRNPCLDADNNGFDGTLDRSRSIGGLVSGVESAATVRTAEFRFRSCGGRPGVAAHKRSNSPWIAELSNPILQPRARSRLKDIADRQKAGLAMLDNDSLCLPVGVLGSLNMFDAMEVLQTPDAVILLYERDHQIRHIYLNVAHSDALGPTWYGDSIGHYEGDTLVVDTIGMNTKTLVDRYGTPHSDNLHTVERYRIQPDGTLEVSVLVEDPIAFTAPWSAKAAFEHNATYDFGENVCAENNLSISDDAIRAPSAASPDF